MSCATMPKNPPTNHNPQVDHSCEGRNLTVSCATIRKIPTIPRSSHRPFLRRQESHSVVCHNAKNPPTNHNPQADHSCVGRNLTVSCATIPKIHQQTIIPKQTIPAKAGISQCRVPQFAKFPQFPVPPTDHSCEGRNLTVSCMQISPNPSTIPRPQADHSCEGRNLTVSCATMPKNPPTNYNPQVDHSCVGRNLIIKCGNAASLRRRMPKFTPPLAAHDCEIPAYAGMVLWGTPPIAKFPNPPNRQAKLPNPKNCRPLPNCPRQIAPAVAEWLPLPSPCPPIVRHCGGGGFCRHRQP